MFRTRKCRFSSWNLSPKKPKIWTYCNHFEQAAFSWRYSVRCLSKWLPTSFFTTILGYGYSWALYFETSTLQTLIENTEMEYRLENYICLPCEGFQVNFESDGMTSLKRGLAADSFTMAALEVTSFETNFFRIAAPQRLKLRKWKSWILL